MDATHGALIRLEAKIDDLTARVAVLAEDLADLQVPAAMPAAATIDATAEQVRQANLYADLLARLPHGGQQEAAELAAKFRADLRHPDLALLSPQAMSLRAAGGWDAPSTIYGIAHEDVITWNGGLLREFLGGDGGQGMFATAAQAAAWPHKVDQGDIVAGPG